MMGADWRTGQGAGIQYRAGRGTTRSRWLPAGPWGSCWGAPASLSFFAEKRHFTPSLAHGWHVVVVVAGARATAAAGAADAASSSTQTSPGMRQLGEGIQRLIEQT